MRQDVTGWLLAGGEGRRMGGQDKGLIDYQGRPLAAWVLQSLQPQCGQVAISANRHHAAYLETAQAICGTPTLVLPDDPDLGQRQGPLAGLITAMRHTQTEWLMVVPCDMPHVPTDLVARLMAHAEQTNADIVTPVTQTSPTETTHHWVCGLIRKRVCPDTERQFVQGERKVGKWVKSQNWASLHFPASKAFANMNTLEILRGRD